MINATPQDVVEWAKYAGWTKPNDNSSELLCSASTFVLALESHDWDGNPIRSTLVDVKRMATKILEVESP